MRLNFQKAFKVISVFALMSPLAFSTSHAVDEIESVANAINMSGYTTLTNSKGDVKRLSNGDTLYVGDILNAGEESSISIKLENGCIVQINENETYTVVESTNEECKDSGKYGSVFNQRSSSSNSPTLSTATSAGGTVVEPTPEPKPEPAPEATPTTPPVSGSPS